jgi:hypothetical protein
VAQRSRLTLDNSIFIFGYDTVRRELTLCAHSHSLMKKERWTDSHSQGLGGGVLVLPTFASEFGITGTATEVANLQGNVVSILQGGWCVQR